MSNTIKKVGHRFLDAAIVGASLFLAYQLRYDGQVPAADNHQMWLLLFPIAALCVFVNELAGIYRFRWRYVTSRDAIHIAGIYASVSLVLLVCRLILPVPLDLLRIPWTVIAIEFVLSLGGALAVRLLWRQFYERRPGLTAGQSERRLLLVGAGDHGVAVAKAMAGQQGVSVVGFLDDDPRKAGSVICGVPVFGDTSTLQDVSRSSNVNEVLICTPPGLRGQFEVKASSKNGNGAKARSRVVPSIDEILNGDFEWPSSNNAAMTGSGEKPQLARFPHEPTEIHGKTILITGGGGFIGSSLAEKLSSDNRVILYDLGFRGAPAEFTSLLKQSHVQAVEGDLLDDAKLRPLALRADIVVHAAAVVGVNRVCGSGRKTLETNYTGTCRLLDALEENTHLERFLYFSTSEVFGAHSFRVQESSPPHIGPITEARWSYAIAKLAGEHLVKSYHRENGLPGVIVRPFNVFGPRRTGDHAMLRFIMSSLKNEPIEVHGDGSQIRSWCYIEDFCGALLQMLIRPQAIGEDFNIGHPGNTLTIQALASKVVEMTGTDVPIRFVESPFPDVEIRVPSLQKAKSLLDYEPRYDLNTALPLTINWYRKNRARMTSLNELAPAKRPVEREQMAAGLGEALA